MGRKPLTSIMTIDSEYMSDLMVRVFSLHLLKGPSRSSGAVQRIPPHLYSVELWSEVVMIEKSPRFTIRGIPHLSIGILVFRRVQ